jgi:amidohydrolase
LTLTTIKIASKPNPTQPKRLSMLDKTLDAEALEHGSHGRIADDVGRYLGQSQAFVSIKGFHSDLTRIRRVLHQHPELGFEENFTADLVAAELARYQVDHVERGLGKTGLVATIKGRLPEPTSKSGVLRRSLGLRADMDALPIAEDNDFLHRSKAATRMHACGHDGHTTMLLGAARYLAKTRQFAGTVNLIFQPGEEGYAGAKAMIADGLFERFPCDAIFAMHNWPSLAPGKLAVRPGPVMAAADRICIKIEGRGGHGAHPYLAIDPVLVAAHVITAAQSIVSRNVSPIDSAVISMCSIQAGNPGAMSVIPSEANIVGTVRTFKKETQELVEQRLRAIVESVAMGFGAKGSLTYERVYPATVNSVDESAFAAEVARDLVGDENFISNLDPSMGAEDFSFMLMERPGAYFRIGQGGGESGCFLHNSRFDFNDNVLPLGAALFARLAERWLAT